VTDCISEYEDKCKDYILLMMSGDM